MLNNFWLKDLVQSSSGGAEHLVMFRLTGLSTVNRLSMALLGAESFKTPISTELTCLHAPSPVLAGQCVGHFIEFLS